MKLLQETVSWLHSQIRDGRDTLEHTKFNDVAEFGRVQARLEAYRETLEKIQSLLDDADS